MPWAQPTGTECVYYFLFQISDFLFQISDILPQRAQVGLISNFEFLIMNWFKTNGVRFYSV